MISRTLEQAEKFYEEHKDEIYKKLAVNFEIECDEYHQVEVRFKDFRIWYQGPTGWDGQIMADAFPVGSTDPLNEMGPIIKNDDFMNGLDALNKYTGHLEPSRFLPCDEDHFVDEFIYYFCDRFAEEHDIVGIIEESYEDEDEDEYDDYDYDEEE